VPRPAARRSTDGPLLQATNRSPDSSSSDL
jgi:hypothetical protein